MKKIQVEGMNYIYLSKDDNLPGKSINGLQVADAPLLRSLWYRIREEGFTDIRLILFQYPIRPDLTHIRFLHWDDQTDLDNLDEKVAKGTFTNKDFKNAVITTLGKTKCYNCGWEGDTLVLFTAEEYASLPDLESQKIEGRVARNSFKPCPNCGTQLRQMVVKIFQNLS